MRDNIANKLPNVVTIMGPTASGKTGLAIELAKHVNGEVISVDSALVYKSMDIGTAKPNLQEQDGIKHHLLDIIEPEEAYSVSKFRKDAIACMHDIVSRHKVPILAGGTMMYFNALINGLSALPESDPSMRKSVQQDIEQNGLVAMHQYLCSIDPVSGKRIHENDTQRITRAIEVFRLSGKTMTDWQQLKSPSPPFSFLQFSIMPDERADLHNRIALRFDQMLAQGFEQEVVKLRARGTLHLDMPAMRSVGYRQMWQHLDGQLNTHEMRERGIIATRQLAKRQVTWLRAWHELISLSTHATNNIDIIMEKLSS